MIFGELSAKVADFRSQFAQSRVIGVVVGTALIKLALMLIDARTSIVRRIEFLQNFDYTKLIVLFLILLWFFRRKPKKMFCAWCGGKKSGLTKETEYQKNKTGDVGISLQDKHGLMNNKSNKMSKSTKRHLRKQNKK